jgi:TrmH family RNA methyltransferase
MPFRCNMARMRKSISFLLVRTRFASNLGAAARVMKNMGLDKLVLVQPLCEVGVEARAMAMKGAEILDRAQYYPDLCTAAQHLDLLVGTTGRFSTEKPLLTDCRVLAREIAPRYTPASRVGIAFGSEDNGLSREELRQCQWMVQIPTAPEYPVLNLAQSVGILAYELWMSEREQQAQQAPDYLHLASGEELQSLMAHLRQTLTTMRLPMHLSISRLLQRLGKIAGRAQLEKEDVNLLHGLLSEADRNVGDR